MRFVRLFLRVTCAKIAFVTGLGIAPAIAVNIDHHTVSEKISAPDSAR
jgi:hypothetical protein